jgi:hypothetical protein
VGLITKKNRLEISCYCPFKILSIAKNTWRSKKCIISIYSKAKNMLKIAEVKLSNCGLREKIAIAEWWNCS